MRGNQEPLLRDRCSGRNWRKWPARSFLRANRTAPSPNDAGIIRCFVCETIKDKAIDMGIGRDRQLEAIGLARFCVIACRLRRERADDQWPAAGSGDRKSVVSGQGVSVRVDLGGSRSIKKKTKKKQKK